MHEYTVLVFIFLACAVFNTAPSALDSLAVASVYLLVAGKLTFTWEFFFFSLISKEEQSVLSLAVSQVSLIQNNNLPLWYILG